MEWDRLKQGTDPSTCIKHTAVEVWWPRFLAPVYLCLLVWGSLSIHDAVQFFWPLCGGITAVWLVYAIWVLLWGGPLHTYWEYTGTDASDE